MSGQKSSDFYREGLNPALDKKLVEYRKMRPFVGNAYVNVLTETESAKMAKLWWKEKAARFRLTILEITTLLEMAAKITVWRKSTENENSRRRMKNFRNRMFVAARKRDPKARKKLKAIKKYHRNMSAKYRKQRREKQAKKAGKSH